MSNYQLGLKALKTLIEDGDSLAYWRAKLSPALFRGDEVAVFAFIQSHYNKFKVLPKPETVLAQFPEIAEVECPEIAGYYLDKLDHRYFHETINNANLNSQAALKKDQDGVDEALKILQEAMRAITQQKYRHKLLDFGNEGPSMVLDAYHKKNEQGFNPLLFGWPYMDDKTGGLFPGDVASFVGRPAQGKSWFMLYVSIYNWVMQRKILFVSMEMSVLAISQRVAAMYTHKPVGQLKMHGFASDTMKAFSSKIYEANDEEGKLYIVDGNLAATVDDIYELAAHLHCDGVAIDGAYLARHKNQRLNRYDRVAENVELMKRFSADMPTFASWQFNRQGAKKNKKQGEKETLEDIGYSDAIGQISSIVIGLMQEETVETIEKRRADLLKGRNGEIGGWDIKWDFASMDFSQITVAEEEEENALAYL